MLWEVGRSLGFVGGRAGGRAAFSSSCRNGKLRGVWVWGIFLTQL